MMQVTFTHPTHGTRTVSEREAVALWERAGISEVRILRILLDLEIGRRVTFERDGVTVTAHKEVTP